MNLIDRYIARNFLSGTAIVLLILLPLFGFLTLSEELENAGQGAFTSFDALVIVVYSMPKLVLELLPVTALMGVLIGLGAMANHRELVIAKAFGYSAWRTAWPVAVVSAVLIAIVLALQFFTVPKLELAAAQIRLKATPQSSQVINDTEIWTRIDNRFIRIGNDATQEFLRDVEIVDLDENGLVQVLTQATRIDILSDDQWLLRDVVVTDFRQGEVREEKLEQASRPSLLSSQQTSTLRTPFESMSPLAIYRQIVLLENNDLDTHRFRVKFWQQISVPVGLLAMSLLGIPFLTGSVRSVSAGQRAAIGSVIGLLFYLTEQMMGHLALLYELSPILATMAPDVILLIAALVGLHRESVA